MARPGATGFVSSAGEAAAPAGALRNGRLAVREVLMNRGEPIGRRLSDAAEILTWRALNTGPDDLARLAQLPERLWTRRGRIKIRLTAMGMEWVSRRGARRNGARAAQNDSAEG